MEYILSELKRVQRRLFMLRMFHTLINGLLVAFIFSAFWLALTRLFPTLGDPLVVGLGAIAGALIGTIGWSIVRRPSLMDAALECDRRLGMRERVTTAVELSAQKLQLNDRSQEMLQAVETDAAYKLQSLNLRNDFPLTSSRAMRWLAVPILLYGVGYVLLPEFDLFNSRERAIEAKLKEQSLTQQAKSLAVAAKALERPDALPKGENDPMIALAKELALVAEKLRSQELSEKQALAKVATLGEKVEAHRKAMEENAPKPDSSAPTEKMGAGKGVADAMKAGKMGEAAKKMREIQEKLKKGNLSDAEKKQLASDMDAMKKMMEQGKGGMNEALAEALAKASAGLNSGDMNQAGAEMEKVALSLEDMQSMLEQMEKMDMAMAQVGEWKEGALGASKFCRKCGKALKPCKKPGNCKNGECGGDHECAGVCSGAGQCSGAGTMTGVGNGSGMGGEGQGAGNRVGDLPKEPVNFAPSVAPGQTTQGKMLATILQQGAPEVNPEATTEYLEGVVVEVQQEAENAMTKQEIPPESREFVRHYFATLEPGQVTAE